LNTCSGSDRTTRTRDGGRERAGHADDQRGIRHAKVGLRGVGSSWAAQSATVRTRAQRFVFVSHGVAACATCAPRTQRKRHHGPDAMCPRVQTQARITTYQPSAQTTTLPFLATAAAGAAGSPPPTEAGVVSLIFVSFSPTRTILSLSLTTTTPPPHTQHTHTHTCTRLYLTFTLAIHPQEGLATVLAGHTNSTQHHVEPKVFF
jgi:hypothetical protein